MAPLRDELLPSLRAILGIDPGPDGKLPKLGMVRACELCSTLPPGAVTRGGGGVGANDSSEYTNEGMVRCNVL